MKKLILASVFVLGSVLAVSAQSETKSCHGSEGTKSSCCKGSNSANTTNTSTKSCCMKGGNSHAQTGTTNKSYATSATAAFATSKTTTTTTATTETGEPK